jgi:hypothetical protein
LCALPYPQKSSDAALACSPRVNLPHGGFDEYASWLGQRNQESTMVTTGKLPRTLIGAASFLGIALALAAPTSAQAQMRQVVPPPTIHHSSNGGSDGGNASGYRYAGVLSHALYPRGDGQTQGLQPGPPPPPRRSSKPPL